MLFSYDPTSNKAIPNVISLSKEPGKLNRDANVVWDQLERGEISTDQAILSITGILTENRDIASKRPKPSHS